MSAGPEVLVARVDIGAVIDTFDRSKHVLVSRDISVGGAAGEGSLFAIALLQQTSSAPIAVRGLHYDDRYRCDDGIWRIAHRRHFLLWAHEMDGRLEAEAA